MLGVLSYQCNGAKYPCGMPFSGGILTTSRLDNRGGLADSSKALAVAPALMMQRLARSKGLRSGRASCFQPDSLLDTMRLQSNCMVVVQVKRSPVSGARPGYAEDLNTYH
jgi:hypothetical protein